MPGMSALPQELPVTCRIDLIVLHCSATPNGRPIGAGAQTAIDVIDRWHQARGFQRGTAARSAFNWRLAHVGYHWVIDLDGTAWTGRHPSEVGAHVAGFNGNSLGICLVGGAEADARFTPQQWTTLRRLVREQCAEHRLAARRPLYPRRGGGVCGHRDLSPDADGDGQVERHEWLKTCPGFDVGLWLERGMEPAPEHLLEAQS